MCVGGPVGVDVYVCIMIAFILIWMQRENKFYLKILRKNLDILYAFILN